MEPAGNPFDCIWSDVQINELRCRGVRRERCGGNLWRRVLGSQHLHNSLTTYPISILGKEDSTFLCGHRVVHSSPNLTTKDLPVECLMALGRSGTMLVGSEKVVHVLLSGLDKHGILASSPCINAPLETLMDIRG